jgi:hypothetical protein
LKTKILSPKLAGLNHFSFAEGPSILNPFVAIVSDEKLCKDKMRFSSSGHVSK